MAEHFVSVKLLLIDRADNALVLRRGASHPRRPHQLDLPGGLAEAGEPTHKALAREVFEETGLHTDVNNLRLLYAVTDVYDYGVFVRMTFGLRVSGVTPMVTVSWEHEAYEWKSVMELASVDCGAQQRGIEMILEHKLWQQL